jgi:spore germination protein KC
VKHALACLLALLLLSGCWSRKEMNDLGFVVGMAIDEGEQEEIRLTLAVARPFDRRNPPPETSWFLSAEGKNLAQAMRRIGLRSSRRLHLHHSGVLLISAEVARQGIEHKLDFTLRETEMRLNQKIFVTVGKADEILRLRDPLRITTSQELEELLRQNPGYDQTLKEFARAAVETPMTAVAPMLTVSPGPTRSPQLAGFALFRNRRMVGRWTVEQGRGALWMLRKKTVAVITTDCPPDVPGTTFSARVRSTRVVRTVAVRGDQVAIDFHVHGSLEMVELNCTLDPIDPNQMRKLEKAMADDLLARIQETWSEVKRTKTDPFGVGKDIQVRYPDFFRRQGERVTDRVAEADVTFHVSIMLKEPGLVTQPVPRRR